MCGDGANDCGVSNSIELECASSCIQGVEDG